MESTKNRFTEEPYKSAVKYLYKNFSYNLIVSISLFVILYRHWIVLYRVAIASPTYLYGFPRNVSTFHFIYDST